MYKYDYTTKKYTKGTNSKTFILLHHTGGVSSLKNMTEYLANNPAQVSAHYVVGQNGDISRIGTDDYILWHAGTGDLIDGYINTMNNHAIGIEVISDGEHFTKQQIKALEKLVKDIQARNNIPTENIIRHKDYSTRKWDIGDNFYKIAWYNSFEEWRNFKEVWEYRNLAWDSVINDIEGASTKLLTEDGRIKNFDEFTAYIELICDRRS